VLKGSRLMLVFPTREDLKLRRSGTRGFGRSREGTDSEHVLESLVAHRLIDLGSECIYTAIGMS